MVRWAPLHGGIRTNVSHVFVHRSTLTDDLTHPEKRLRQEAGRIGLKGTIVGLTTSADPLLYGSGNALFEDLCIWSISLFDYRQIVKVPNLEVGEASTTWRSSCLLLMSNRHLTHEAMLEAMSVATETRTRLIGHRTDRNTINLVAVAAAEERHRAFSGNRGTLVRLVSAACEGSLRAHAAPQIRQMP